MNERIKRLRRQSLRAVPELSAERGVLLTRFYQSAAARNLSAPLLRAGAFSYLLSHKKIVILPGENPALEIIRKAIEKKKERNSKLNTYEFEAYTKGLIRTTDEISARGRTVSAGVGTSEDSADLKITGLLENQSRGYFKKPDQFKDVIIARKQSANFPPTINTVTGGRLVQNLYEDDISFFSGNIPGPISDDALDYYYYFIDAVVYKNDRKVYKLYMKPENSDDHG